MQSQTICSDSLVIFFSPLLPWGFSVFTFSGIGLFEIPPTTVVYLARDEQETLNPEMWCANDVKIKDKYSYLYRFMPVLATQYCSKCDHSMFYSRHGPMIHTAFDMFMNSIVFLSHCPIQAHYKHPPGVKLVCISLNLTDGQPK